MVSVVSSGGVAATATGAPRTKHMTDKQVARDVERDREEAEHLGVCWLIFTQCRNLKWYF